MIIDHYGLHRTEGGIPLLVQQGRIDHVLGIDMDFGIRVRIRRPCTHRINLDEAEGHSILDKYADDPLFQAMLPLPHEQLTKPLFIEQTPESLELLTLLSRLTSPGTFTIMVPFWTQRPEVHARTLWETNIQPLILHGFRLEHASALHKVIEVATLSPRRLILLGERRTTPNVGLADRVNTGVRIDDLRDVALEAVGAYALKTHMLACQ